MANPFRGSYTVAITPFTEDGSALDFPALRRFLDWQLQVGVPGIIILGTTGEFLTVTDEERRRLVEATVQKFGRVDILVNNAGTSKRGSLLEHTDAVWAADFELKVFGAIRLVKLVVPHMRKVGGGRIINVTNIGAKTPGAQSTPTSISRAAGIALTKAMSKEFAPDNILVNTVCIGKIKSGQHERRFKQSGESAESYYANSAKDIPLGRVGEAEEAANAIVFLASSMGSYVTGTSINMDGGLAGTV